MLNVYLRVQEIKGVSELAQAVKRGQVRALAGRWECVRLVEDLFAAAPPWAKGPLRSALPAAASVIEHSRARRFIPQ